MPETDDRVRGSAQTDEGSTTMPMFGDHVDDDIFSQILDMDENDVLRDFSAPLVTKFFEQADETFGKMDTAVAEENLAELYSLGHFLKGSSSTLGFNKIRDSCQIIQECGKKPDADPAAEGDEGDEGRRLRKIEDAIAAAKTDTAELKNEMMKFFGLE